MNNSINAVFILLWITSACNFKNQSMENQENSVNKINDGSIVIGSSDKKKYVDRTCTDPEMNAIFAEFSKANEKNFPYSVRTTETFPIDSSHKKKDK